MEDSNKIELSNEQQLLILKEWNNRSENPPSIIELTKLAFPDLKEIDARSKQSRVIRDFLAEKGIKAFQTQKTKGLLELTTEQKEYINNNCSSMRPYEMARILFKSPELSQSSQESRSVNAYAKTLDKVLFDSIENPPSEKYNPPRTMDRVCCRINKYVNGANFDFKNLSPKQKKQCDALVRYLHCYRFSHQIDIFDSERDKELFESSFIKYTYDKTDLTEEDVDLYIILSTEIVSDSNIQKTIYKLQEEQDRTIEESGKMSMSLVDSIKVARDDHNACIKRQQSLYESLTEERSKRLKDETKDKTSLLDLINAWKTYESRQVILKLAKEKKDILRKEIQELENLEDIKMRILGISPDEVING